MNTHSKCIFFITTMFLNILSLNLFAYQYEDWCSGRFAIQGAMATGGNLGIGVVHYTEITEFGLTISGQINNSHHSTKTATPVVFAGLRNSLCEGTYLAFGLNFANTFGVDHGKKIKYDISGGPYVSLEQMLTYHLMLVFWIDPYQYNYQKIGKESTSTQSFFSTGGIGLNYLF